MVAKFSAGILLFRMTDTTEVLLGHMGGPFWAKKDGGAWSLPKGEYDPATEEPRVAAAREFTEELGLPVPDGEWVALGDVTYGSGKSRKQLSAWAIEGDLDADAIVPGTFEMEWPPKSGKLAEFPEIDRAGWFDLATAADKLGAGQRPLLDRLAELIANRRTAGAVKRD
ncbi:MULTISPECIES: NUDIX domain-containing protein [unclassified Nocardia]|uniref:NUDIX domain-containing protein n=1 Tax=unclassified Nocardia TaxID=2637762 RepID=UPI001CE49B66|nr:MULTISPECIES: NUDIX domain-containing protein [unclassified Nocardia]